MELMDAGELYEISRIRPSAEKETIADALMRAAKSGSVELFLHEIKEEEIEQLTAKEYHVEKGTYAVGDDSYRIRIYWGKDAFAMRKMKGQ